MRALRVGLLALCVLAGPAAASTADVARVDADAQGTDRPCPLEALPDACPATWWGNGTWGVGDDRVESSVFVDEVRVVLQPAGGGPPRRVTLTPSDLVVTHPAGREAEPRMNETWRALNASRPPEAEPYVSFESRPHRYKTSDGRIGEGDWGLFMTIYAPPPVAAPPLSPFAWCWEICTVNHQTFMRVNQSEVQPFPNNVFLRSWRQENLDTDDIVTRNLRVATRCDGSLEWCDAATMDPVTATARDAFLDGTPTLSAGFQMNRTSVAVEPVDATHARDPPAAASPPPPRRPAEDAPPRRSEPPAASPRAAAPAADADGGPVALGAPALPPTLPRGGAPAGAHALPPDILPLLVAGGAAVALALLLGWLLYHRVAAREVLNQSMRRRMYDLIRRSPGARVAHLAAELGIAHNTAKYHLARLAEGGFVRQGSGARPLYFPAGHVARDHPRAEALAHATTRSLHALLVERGSVEKRALPSLLRCSRATAARAIWRLEGVGLATRARVGGRTVVRLCPDAPGDTERLSGRARLPSA